jgi:hypothetical protein
MKGGDAMEKYEAPRLTVLGSLEELTLVTSY